MRSYPDLHGDPYANNCGERLLERRCPECNLFTRRIGSGGCCPACGDTITVEELLEATTI